MVSEIMKREFGMDFSTEVPIKIGNPPKEHRCDCVSSDQTGVVECKSYSWTSTGNIPSAKLMGLNEAVFYMSYLPKETHKIIAMRKATYSGKKETLAEYYNRIDGHLLQGISIAEIDENECVRWIRKNMCNT